jgi:hypothetical protein
METNALPLYISIHIVYGDETNIQTSKHPMMLVPPRTRVDETTCSSLAASPRTSRSTSFHLRAMKSRPAC